MYFAFCSPETSFTEYATLSLITGTAGANFASSSAYVSLLFPHRLKGLALGLNAAIGNMGVGLIQLLIPYLVIIELSKSLQQNGFISSDSGIVWLENIPIFMIPVVLFSILISLFFMKNIAINKTDIRSQLIVIKDPHTWNMCLLYSATFGSFIGFASVFPLILSQSFPINTSTYNFAFLGAAISSAMRPLGHILSKKFGSVSLTIFVFILMFIMPLVALVFLPRDGYSGNFLLFLLSFLGIFVGTGLGKGSTTAMIPDLYHSIFLRKSNLEHKKNTLETNITIAAVIGFTSAIATFFAFTTPLLLSFLYSINNNYSLFLITISVSFLLCAFFTFFVYFKESKNNPLRFHCNGKSILADSPFKAEQIKNRFEDI